MSPKGCARGGAFPTRTTTSPLCFSTPRVHFSRLKGRRVNSTRATLASTEPRGQKHSFASSAKTSGSRRKRLPAGGGGRPLCAACDSGVHGLHVSSSERSVRTDCVWIGLCRWLGRYTHERVEQL